MSVDPQREQKKVLLAISLHYYNQNKKKYKKIETLFTILPLILLFTNILLNNIYFMILSLLLITIFISLNIKLKYYLINKDFDFNNIDESLNLNNIYLSFRDYQLLEEHLDTHPELHLTDEFVNIANRILNFNTIPAS